MYSDVLLYLCINFSNVAILCLVIEVSCGEYGDNVRNLVNAIANGKHDIREGKPFPMLKESNLTAARGNGQVKNKLQGEAEVSNGEKNGAISSTFAFATNYLAKESNGEFLIEKNMKFMFNSTI